MQKKIKLKMVTACLCCVLVLSAPVQAYAFLDLSFDILSFGPLSLGFGIPLRGGVLGLLGAGLLVGAAISFFSGGSGSGYSYAASYPNAPPPPKHVRVSMTPGDHYKGDALRSRLLMKEVGLDEYGRVSLPGGRGYLEVEQETGKMIFREAGFEGYMYYHNTPSLSVWDSQDNPVLVFTVNDDRLLIIQEKSEKASNVLQLVLGGKS
ncbi:Uncharacterized protein dnl_15540 [Desulfonema limicola]|uniref:Bacterial Pleckstrin homology domain-containing protein n=1 Tax=Desulfonema limicola TaxID=45656 RepID=A0A975B5S6_9BACT|nr:hypothetical protein [Desulfonema limicola]QTA79296.1 Uncharacterized protein dnl_15540 [Desulfonema limicola]